MLLKKKLHYNEGQKLLSKSHEYNIIFIVEKFFRR